MTERRLSRFRVGERVILPDGEVTVRAASEDDGPAYKLRFPVLVPCVRLTDWIPGRGPISMGGYCHGHEDCRADWHRRTEEGRRHAEARGKPVPPKSRIRPMRPERGDTPTV